MAHEPNPPKSIRRTLVRWLPTLMLVPLLGYVIWSLRAQTSQLAAILAWQSLPAFVAAAASLVVTQLLMAFRQLLLLRHIGVQIRFRTVRQVTFAGLFANNIMPAGTGYDFARLVLLRAPGLESKGTVAGLVLLDRLIGLLAISLLAVFGLACMASGGGQSLFDISLGSMGIILLAPLPLMASLVVLRHQWTFDLLMRLAGSLVFADLLQRLLMSMRGFSTKKRILLAALLLAITGLFFAALAIAFIAYGIYGADSFLSSLLLSPLILFAASVPVTPANLGWTETVADTTWGFFGLQGGMVVFLTLRLITMVVSLVGCTHYLTIRKTISSREAS